ncbi:hypothetical protein HTZ84_07060 [Haloterrigena sp. SYSU A558-1]|uniref:Uncharacterized protein n=1 Tax=Haloterrigena gelatinilytica TaxID=2741724 RepID=A0A8J8GQF1_9EURY|nr:hypothetical protein [Haloterrigena gelatinilytica]NUB92102.1 hypothetical protein [Haloterrigena gelatinilytica]NUC72068.1 hypothetical protein [Haloterrigena gelatinilytica]
MSLAAETRRAVDRRPFLRAALRAGVVNYTAAARYLDVDEGTDAVATALRRYAEELPAYDTGSRDARVRMQSGIAALDDGSGRGERGDGEATGTDDGDSEPGLLTVGGTTFGPRNGDGSLTAIVATGAVDSRALATALQALSIDDTEPVAAAVGDGSLVVVVDRRDGAMALRTIEDALERVPAAASSER